MYKKKYVAVLVLLALLCSCLCGCQKAVVSDPTVTTVGTEPVQTVSTTEAENTDPTETTAQPTEAESVDPTEEVTEPEETVPVVQVVTPVDIDTVGGAVIVGVIGHDEQGWYLQPEQPLNVTYEYFLDNPSVFPQLTRIAMFDPKVDGIEKALYIGQTVTVEGTFRFYRDDFETLYFAP